MFVYYVSNIDTVCYTYVIIFVIIIKFWHQLQYILTDIKHNLHMGKKIHYVINCEIQLQKLHIFCVFLSVFENQNLFESQSGLFIL